MPSILEMKNERGQVWAAMRSLLDTADAERRELTRDERADYDKYESRLERLSSQIDDEQRGVRHERRSRDYDAPANMGDPTPEHRDGRDELFVRYLRQGPAVEAEMRAAAAGTGSAGGYLVPTSLRMKITERLKQVSSVRAVAEVFRTDGGETVNWPTVDDTSNVGVILAENTQFTEQDVTFGTKTLGAYTYVSKTTRVSWQLLQDAGFPVESFLSKTLGTRIGRIQNQHFTTGTGSSQPQGIVTGATSGVTAAGTSATTLDELISLVHSVDPSYRDEDAMFMMGDVALSALRKLKDGQSNYLIQPSVTGPWRDTLFGYPVIVNVDMPTPATGVKSVLFGNFRAGYVIRDSQQIEMITLQERYADYLQNAYFCWARADSVVQDANAYKALTMA